MRNNYYFCHVKRLFQDNFDMPIRVDVRADSDQTQKKRYFLCCPKCKQKLGDIEYLHGTAIMRFKCRRCGTYVKADLIGVE